MFYFMNSDVEQDMELLNDGVSKYWGMWIDCDEDNNVKLSLVASVWIAT